MQPFVSRQMPENLLFFMRRFGWVGESNLRYLFSTMIGWLGRYQHALVVRWATVVWSRFARGSLIQNNFENGRRDDEN
jgi:hypothetical protein